MSVLSLISFAAFGEEQVRIRAPQGPGDAAFAYYKDLLQTVLQNTTEDYGEAHVVVTDLNVSQARSLLLVRDSNYLDVEWAGTNREREEMLRAIRVPLNMGLLGERLLVIKKSRHDEFDKITGAQQLKTLIACQGQHWPDSDILEQNQFTVERIIVFELMWDMLTWDRCDYFPRAVIEGYVEVNKYGSDRFDTYDRILISYPFPMFFFISKKKEQMAQRIESGLLKMLQDGSLLSFMEHHEATQSAFPLSRYKNSLRIKIDNPFLSDDTRRLMKSLQLPDRLFNGSLPAHQAQGSTN
ncbi:hypothetical protein [Hahella sp. CCB-MM4]|uniref:hypothetical protein n=1 Tax=Hahella sp. (strain CCB-MM4) TaxID=1926491 RepID=UPI000B9A8EAF|nr:hypothetical protein [Hahella sp. CCB-MM4]